MHTVHFAPELIDLRQNASKPREMYGLIFCNFFYVVAVAYIRQLAELFFSGISCTIFFYLIARKQLNTHYNN